MISEVLGFLSGAGFGFLAGLVLTFAYGAFRIRQLIDNAGEHATGLVQKGVMKAVKVATTKAVSK